MKGKKEGGEIKGREGRKEERRKRRREKKEREKKKTQQGSNPRPSTLQPTAAWRVDSHVRTVHVYIANFDLTVAALAPSIMSWGKLKAGKSSVGHEPRT